MTRLHGAMATVFAEDFADLAGRLAETARSWAEMDRVGRWRAAFALRVALLDQARQFHDTLAGWAKLGFTPPLDLATAGSDARWRLLVAAYAVGAASAGCDAVPEGDGPLGPVLARLEEAAREA